MNTTVDMLTQGENFQRTSAPKAISKPAPLRARPTCMSGMGGPAITALPAVAKSPPSTNYVTLAVNNGSRYTH